MSSTTVIDPPRPPAPRATSPRATLRTHAAWPWVAIGLVTLGAALLRFVNLGSVPVDPYYDAAVRSMGLSWHNFFFGAFEPGASVSIDKPPVDLWLQVASVKLLGFNSVALKVPEALAGTLSVPLLFAVVRRLFGVRAAIAAAIAMAVLPIEVLTSRSDTMDALMMLLVLTAVWCLVRASETGNTRWMLMAGVALGVAFNVKLLESVIPLPALAVFAYLGLPGSRRRRVGQLALAGVVYVVVALSWLTATLLFPAHERPYAIGSVNGSAWNAAFVFNGTDRVSGSSVNQVSFSPNHVAPTATQVQRDHISITPPSPTRLLARVGPLSGQRLGLELLVALLLGGPALLIVLVRGRRLPALARRRDPAAVGTRPAGAAAVSDQQPATPGAADAPPTDEATQRDPTADVVRRQRAAAAALLLWLVLGIVAFSQMQRLHPRYVEAFTPAVAAVFGIGVAWASVPRGLLRLAMLGMTTAAVVIYGASVLYGTGAIWWVTAVFALLTLAAAVASWLSPAAQAVAEPEIGIGTSPAPPAGRPRERRWLAPLGALTAALALVATLAIPLRSSILGIQEKVSTAGNVGAIPQDQLALISSYLRAHQGRARYEVAAASATSAGALIVKDLRPVLILTTYNARTLTSVARLRQLVRAGAVRYVFINTVCGAHTARTDAACSAPALWVRDHGTDVSRQAGLKRGKELWRLPRSIA